MSKSQGESFYCDVCNLPYDSRSQYLEHQWSMLHHTNLEKKVLVVNHECALCKVQCSNLSEYSVHLIKATHRDAQYKRQQQLRILNTPQRRHQQQRDYSRDHFDGDRDVTSSSESDSQYAQQPRWQIDRVGQQQYPHYHPYRQSNARRPWRYDYHQGNQKATKKRKNAHHSPPNSRSRGQRPLDRQSKRHGNTSKRKEAKKQSSGLNRGEFDVHRSSLDPSGSYGNHQWTSKSTTQSSREHDSTQRAACSSKPPDPFILDALRHAENTPQYSREHYSTRRNACSKSSGPSILHALHPAEKSGSSSWGSNLSPPSEPSKPGKSAIRRKSEMKNDNISRGKDEIGHRASSSMTPRGEDSREELTAASRMHSIVSEPENLMTKSSPPAAVQEPVASEDIGAEYALSLEEKSLNSLSSELLYHQGSDVTSTVSKTADTIVPQASTIATLEKSLNTENDDPQRNERPVSSSLQSVPHVRSTTANDTVPLTDDAGGTAKLSQLSMTPNPHPPLEKNLLPEVIQKDIRKLARNRLSRPNVSSSRVVSHPATHPEIAISDLKEVLLDLFERPAPLHRKTLIEGQLKELFISAGKTSDRFKRFGVHLETQQPPQRDTMIEMLEKLTEEDMAVLYRNESQDIINDIISLFQTPDGQSLKEAAPVKSESAPPEDILGVAEELGTGAPVADEIAPGDAESSGSDIEIIESDALSEILLSSDDDQDMGSVPSQLGSQGLLLEDNSSEAPTPETCPGQSSRLQNQSTGRSQETTLEEHSLPEKDSAAPIALSQSQMSQSSTLALVNEKEAGSPRSREATRERQSLPEKSSSVPVSLNQSRISQSGSLGLVTVPPHSRNTLSPSDFGAVEKIVFQPGEDSDPSDEEDTLPEAAGAESSIHGQVFQLSMAETKVAAEIKQMKKEQKRIKSLIKEETKKLSELQRKLTKKKHKMKMLRKDRRKLTSKHLKIAKGRPSVVPSDASGSSAVLQVDPLKVSQSSGTTSSSSLSSSTLSASLSSAPNAPLAQTACHTGAASDTSMVVSNASSVAATVPGERANNQGGSRLVNTAMEPEPSTTAPQSAPAQDTAVISSNASGTCGSHFRDTLSALPVCEGPGRKASLHTSKEPLLRAMTPEDLDGMSGPTTDVVMQSTKWACQTGAACGENMIALNTSSVAIAVSAGQSYDLGTNELDNPTIKQEPTTPVLQPKPSRDTVVISSNTSQESFPNSPAALSAPDGLMSKLSQHSNNEPPSLGMPPGEIEGVSKPSGGTLQTRPGSDKSVVASNVSSLVPAVESNNPGPTELVSTAIKLEPTMTEPAADGTRETPSKTSTTDASLVLPACRSSETNLPQHTGNQPPGMSLERMDRVSESTSSATNCASMESCQNGAAIDKNMLASNTASVAMIVPVDQVNDSRTNELVHTTIKHKPTINELQPKPVCGTRDFPSNTSGKVCEGLGSRVSQHTSEERLTSAMETRGMDEVSQPTVKVSQHSASKAGDVLPISGGLTDPATRTPPNMVLGVTTAAEQPTVRPALREIRPKPISIVPTAPATKTPPSIVIPVTTGAKQPTVRPPLKDIRPKSISISSTDPATKTTFNIDNPVMRRPKQPTVRSALPQIRPKPPTCKGNISTIVHVSPQQLTAASVGLAKLTTASKAPVPAKPAALSSAYSQPIIGLVNMTSSSKSSLTFTPLVPSTLSAGTVMNLPLASAGPLMSPMVHPVKALTPILKPSNPSLPVFTLGPSIPVSMPSTPPRRVTAPASSQAKSAASTNIAIKSKGATGDTTSPEQTYSGSSGHPLSRVESPAPLKERTSTTMTRSLLQVSSFGDRSLQSNLTNHNLASSSQPQIVATGLVLNVTGGPPAVRMTNPRPAQLVYSPPPSRIQAEASSSFPGGSPLVPGSSLFPIVGQFGIPPSAMGISIQKVSDEELKKMTINTDRSSAPDNRPPLSVTPSESGKVQEKANTPETLEPTNERPQRGARKKRKGKEAKGTKFAATSSYKTKLRSSGEAGKDESQNKNAEKAGNHEDKLEDMRIGEDGPSTGGDADVVTSLGQSFTLELLPPMRISSRLEPSKHQDRASAVVDSGNRTVVTKLSPSAGSTTNSNMQECSTFGSALQEGETSAESMSGAQSRGSSEIPPGDAMINMNPTSAVGERVLRLPDGFLREKSKNDAIQEPDRCSGTDDAPFPVGISRVSLDLAYGSSPLSGEASMDIKEELPDVNLSEHRIVPDTDQTETDVTEKEPSSKPVAILRSEHTSQNIPTFGQILENLHAKEISGDLHRDGNSDDQAIVPVDPRYLHRHENQGHYAIAPQRMDSGVFVIKNEPAGSDDPLNEPIDPITPTGADGFCDGSPESRSFPQAEVGPNQETKDMANNNVNITLEQDHQISHADGGLGAEAEFFTCATSESEQSTVKPEPVDQNFDGSAVRPLLGSNPDSADDGWISQGSEVNDSPVEIQKGHSSLADVSVTSILCSEDLTADDYAQRICKPVVVRLSDIGSRLAEEAVLQGSILGVHGPITERLRPRNQGIEASRRGPKRKQSTEHLLALSGTRDTAESTSTEVETGNIGPASTDIALKRAKPKREFGRVLITNPSGPVKRKKKAKRRKYVKLVQLGLSSGYLEIFRRGKKATDAEKRVLQDEVDRLTMLKNIAPVDDESYGRAEVKRFTRLQQKKLDNKQELRKIKQKVLRARKQGLSPCKVEKKRVVDAQKRRLLHDSQKDQDERKKRKHMADTCQQDGHPNVHLLSTVSVPMLPDDAECLPLSSVGCKEEAASIPPVQAATHGSRGEEEQVSNVLVPVCDGEVQLSGPFQGVRESLSSPLPKERTAGPITGKKSRLREKRLQEQLISLEKLTDQHMQHLYISSKQLGMSPGFLNIILKGKKATRNEKKRFAKRRQQLQHKRKMAQNIIVPSGGSIDKACVDDSPSLIERSGSPGSVNVIIGSPLQGMIGTSDKNSCHGKIVPGEPLPEKETVHSWDRGVVCEPSTGEKGFPSELARGSPSTSQVVHSESTKLSDEGKPDGNRPPCEDAANLGKAILDLRTSHSKVFASSRDGFVRCYDPKSLSVERVFAGHQKRITGMWLHHTAEINYLITCSLDCYLMWHSLKVDDAETGYKFFDHAITCMVGRRNQLFLALSNGYIECYNMPMFQCISFFQCQADVRSIAIASYQAHPALITASSDGVMNVYGVDGGHLGSLKGHHSPVLAINFRHPYVFSGDTDGSLIQNNIENMKTISSFDHKGAVTCIKSHDTVYTSSLDNHIRIFSHSKRGLMLSKMIPVQDILCIHLYQHKILFGRTDGTLGRIIKPAFKKIKIHQN